MMTEEAIRLDSLIAGLSTMPTQIWQRIPTHTERWNVTASHSAHRNNIDKQYFTQTVRNASQYKDWKWPKKRLLVVADPHADGEAFVASLIASGGIKKTGKRLTEFELTKSGKKSIFIIAGDCLDKGPSNLELLDCIRVLMGLAANIKLLAGNHDMRLFMGIHAIGLKRDYRTEHLFVRMGGKVIPLFREVYDRYLNGKLLSKKVPDEAECKKRLFPRSDWFEQFPLVAKHVMTDSGIKRELRNMHKKHEHFESACFKAGLSMRQVYAVAMKCRQLFLQPKGKYAWFFEEMQLAYRKGSFLFIHAGLDDGIIDTISSRGLRYVNKQFREHIKQDLFSFYYGSLANTMRTKYRPVDLPLTSHAVAKINKKGIHAIVHGHINRKHGQRLGLKHGLIHVECDVTIDRNSRKKEGMTDYGIGITIIDPSKRVIGISSDYPYAKVFEPEHYLSAQEA